MSHKHRSVVWQTQADIRGIIKRKGLDYPDEDPTVLLRLSEHDLITDSDSFFPTAFYELASSLTPPLYGLTEMAFIYGEDCLPTSLQTPLFNLRSLEVLRALAPGAFTEYPVFVLEIPIGLRLASAKEYLTDSRVKVSTEGYALIQPTFVFDNKNAQAIKSDHEIILESDLLIPALFRSGDVFYFSDDLRKNFIEKNITGLAFKAALGLSAFA